MNTLEKSLIIGAATVASVAVINKVDAASYGSYITTNNLNLRASMSTNSQKLLTIPKGGKVTLIMKYSNGWSKVSYNGRTGFVSSQYLTTGQSSNNNNNNSVGTRCTSGYATNTLIIVDKSSRRVNFYKNCKLIRSMPCAIGKASTQTPSGKYRILEKIQNRPYYKDHIPGGHPSNPLGKYWLGIGNGYALHGTNNEGSIGGAVSHGCMRMYNSDIKWLYSQVKQGTTVLIDNGGASNIASKYRFKIYY